MLDKLTEMGYLDYMKKRPLTRKVSAMSIDKFIESQIIILMQCRFKDCKSRATSKSQLKANVK